MEDSPLRCAAFISLSSQSPEPVRQWTLPASRYVVFNLLMNVTTLMAAAGLRGARPFHTDRGAEIARSPLSGSQSRIT